MTEANRNCPKLMEIEQKWQTLTKVTKIEQKQLTGTITKFETENHQNTKKENLPFEKIVDG